MTRIHFLLNGQPATAEVDHDTTLLAVLRDQCGITTVKDGCSPSGQCGACAVFLDGQLKTSCAFHAEKIAGRSVVTHQGLPDSEQQIYARAFSESGGMQCGFCIPGMVMCAKHILDHHDHPTRAEISHALGGHLCRCTGYVKILDAIERAAALRRGEEPPSAVDASGRIGSTLPRYRGVEHALGAFQYTGDLRAFDMLHGALLLSPHPRARVISIDTSEASGLPGVHAVLGAADVPGTRHQGLIEADWPIFVAAGETTRYVGDVLCAVAAETPALARQAIARIHVEYEVLPPITSPEHALKPAAPLVHPEDGRGSNLLSQSRIVRGDVDAALAGSAHVVEATFHTPFIEHAFLEPESCLAVPPGARDIDGQPTPILHVYSQGQGVYEDQRQIASALGIAADSVRVTLVSAGGAFGGKEDLLIQAQTALLAVRTGRPVRLTLDRVESIRMHPKRHAMTLRYTVGCDESGRLTAVRAHITGDKGAYASVGAKVIERACGHATGAYEVPHIEITGHAVYTNNPPCGAMRGFGVNQANFAIESLIDQLAERAGLDAWQMRERNALSDGSIFCSGQRLRAVGLRQTLEKIRPYYEEAKRQGKAVGLACGIKNVGIGNGVTDLGRAALTIEDDGTITLQNGYSEMGQGLFTVLIQLASQATGIAPDRFRATVDTRDGLPSGMTTASRGTVCSGRAVLDAAQKLAVDLKDRPLSAWVGRRYEGTFRFDQTQPLGSPTGPDGAPPITHLSFGYATQLVIVDAQGHIERVVAVHDVGRVLNRGLLEGQIQGAIHMGLGFALTEELIVEGGQIQNPTLRGLGVLRAPHMPSIDVLFVEEPDPEGPLGAKGVGELGLVPTAPAVAAALYRHDGKRRFALPMKDSAAAQLLSPLHHSHAAQGGIAAHLPHTKEPDPPSRR
ncbi:MAG: selenium-dependent xanthine dehydrogenase [Myxococcales bacterium]|nr:selenium-dependent xanthine dehydrogenase [Myxococcales bacterium]